MSIVHQPIALHVEPTKKAAKLARDRKKVRKNRPSGQKIVHMLTHVVPMVTAVVPPHPTLKNASVQQCLAAAPDAVKDSFNSMRKGMIRSVLGTQQPVVKICSTTQTIAASTSIILQEFPVNPGSAPIATNWTSWSAIFDEYRVLKARFHIVVEQAPGTVGAGGTPVNWCIFVMDYDDAGALGSTAAAMAYDSKVLVPLTLAGNNGQFHHLDYLPEGQPDLAWTTTATPVSAAWAKVLNVNATVGASTTYYTVFWEYEIEFRQVV